MRLGADTEGDRCRALLVKARAKDPSLNATISEPIRLIVQPYSYVHANWNALLLKETNAQLNAPIAIVVCRLSKSFGLFITDISGRYENDP